MLFNSYIFVLLFLPICLIGYYTINHFKKYNLAQAFLLGMSLWFYGYFNVSYLLIIISSVLINFGIYRLIMRYQGKKAGKALMIAGVLINLGILCYFKYMDFFISNFNALFRTDIKLLGILLPLGISFFTFQQISFIVDAYRGEIPGYDFLCYACFVTFFPQLIAGPIVTHDELVPQFMNKEKKTVDWDNISKGIYIFTLGLTKKRLLADIFGDYVTYCYTTYDSLSSFAAFLVMLSYTFQIYFDFSGYCDMAIGIGKMFNIDLPINFNSPYKSLTVSEFWKRWHMTLTRFFTKYVYIPLGGNRKGKVRTYINVMIVFLASGLWHGASWTFVFWGALHGAAVVINRAFSGFFAKIPKTINWLMTFLFVNAAWVFFRADSFELAAGLFKKMFAFDLQPLNQTMLDIFRLREFRKIFSIIHLETYFPALMITAYFVIAFVLIFGKKNAYEKMQSFTPNVKNWLVTVFLLVWCLFSFAGISTFLYFNF